MPASAPKVADRRRQPRSVECGRPLFGIVAEEEDGEEGADVVAELDEGVNTGPGDEGHDTGAYVARVERQCVVIEGSPGSPDGCGIERSDCLVKPAADERMGDCRARHVVRESSAVRWTVFMWDLHSM